MNSVACEASRVSTMLGHPDTPIEVISERVMAIHDLIAPNSRYRDIRRLTPLVLYYYFRDRGLPIDVEKLIDVSHITKRTFCAFTSQIARFYARPTRSSRIAERSCMECGRPLYFDDYIAVNAESSEKWLKKLWGSPYIQLYCCECYKKINLHHPL